MIIKWLLIDGCLLFYWLGREDSNLRMAAPKAAALPLGDSPTPGLQPIRFRDSTSTPALSRYWLKVIINHQRLRSDRALDLTISAR